jgi:hypothetical protein
LANDDRIAKLLSLENLVPRLRSTRQASIQAQETSDQMKILIPLFLYAVLSMPPGLFILFRAGITDKWSKAKIIWIVVLLGGPPALYSAIYFMQYREAQVFKQDVAYVKELCAKDGGDKILRTADNVEGIFQIKPRARVTELSWSDQFGMPDPWGRAQGDNSSDRIDNRGRPSIPLGPESVGTGKHGYWFLEQHEDMRIGPPYQRVIGGSRDVLTVATLRSRFGYLSEDISTPEMRRRWIAGGRITIVDLQTREVLATRSGYFRAAGLSSPMHWSSAWSGANCPQGLHLSDFLLTVLKPPVHPATPDQVSLLRKQD